MMTNYDYYMVMKRVRIADLKARLSAHLKSVRRGEVIMVLDRDTPVARIVPHREGESLLAVRGRRPGASLKSVCLPRPLEIDVDAVELLLDDRREGR